MTERFGYAPRPVLISAFVASLILMLAGSAWASGPLEKVIHTFQGGSDGQYPSAGLISDKKGNLYGTTASGGGTTACPSGCGTVFELSPPATAGGAWTETQIYIFQGGANDGAYPVGTLLMDKVGNLYGATSDLVPYNGGTVFELSPPVTPGGAWSETILYTFVSDGSRGFDPGGNFVFDGEGNLYGSTASGGPRNCGNCDGGMIFELSPPAAPGGVWTETILHEFGLVANDGINPTGHLVFDPSGALYGTTSSGGNVQYGAGTVFQMKRHGGVWTMKILVNFPSQAIYLPIGGVIIDNAGNLYGTAAWGGYDYVGNTNLCPVGGEGCGGVFELSPPSAPGDPWKETDIYFLEGITARDGAEPNGALLMDKAGNLYGTAPEGGLNGKKPLDQGMVFELSPPTQAGAQWKETKLHFFSGPKFGDGAYPQGNLTQFNGSFYGTTPYGGSANLGTVFSIVVTP